MKEEKELTTKEELYYTIIGHIEDTGTIGTLDIRGLSSIGIEAYTYKLESNSAEEFLDKVKDCWSKMLY